MNDELRRSPRTRDECGHVTCRIHCIGGLSDHIGYVTNRPLAKASQHTGALMSQVICGRPECRKRAEREVREYTGEQPLFCKFAEVTS